MGFKIDEEWSLKKRKNEAASKSAFVFKINSSIKDKEQFKAHYSVSTKDHYSKEVIVKITGGAWSKRGIKNSVEYISKDHQLEIIDSNGIKYNSEKEIQNVIKRLQENTVINAGSDPSKKVKFTHNMVFSTSKYADVKKEDMLKAASKALKEKYPDNYFVAAYHDDTDNPHVHVVLNINKDTGERINIRKKDLRDLREGYCKHLIDYGYDVKATRKYGRENKEFKELSSTDNRNIYQLVDFGTESYQLNKRKSQNNYLIYKTVNNKEVTIWGKELLKEITNSNVKKGDLIRINQTGSDLVKVPIYDSYGVTILDWKQAKRNKWDIEKVGSHSIKPKQEYTEEIKLDSPEQAAKQLKKKQKFNHEKRLLLDPKYKENSVLEQKLERKRHFGF